MTKRWWWLALSGAVACDDFGGETAMYRCDYTETALAPDDPALDTTAAAIGSSLDGVFTHAATWADGTPVAATMDLSLALDGALLRQGGCGDHIAIPAVAVIDTADGGFDALTFDVELQVVTGGSIGGWATIDAADVTGSWVPRALEPNETRLGVSLRLEGSVDAPAAVVSDDTEGSDATAAWSASDPILTLGEGSLATNP